MRFKREELLSKLHSVRPAVAQKEILQQSSCIIIQRGFFFTYDDVTSCKIPSGLNKDLQGAVKANTLIAFLEKLQQEDISLELEKGYLVIKSKGEGAKFRVEEDIQLSTSNVEKPSEWKPLPEEFDEAIKIVQPCCGNGNTDYRDGCVHFHPKWIEATDQIQFVRYRLRTGIEMPFLVKSNSLRHICSLGMKEFSETENWVHFKNPKTKLVLSSRRYMDGYPDLKEVFKIRGKALKLPEGLVDNIERANVFVEETARPKITVELNKTRMKLTGEGMNNIYWANKEIDYQGEPIKFGIIPKILSELGKRYSQCEVSETHIRVKGERFTYVSCLYANQEQENGSEGD